MTSPLARRGLESWSAIYKYVCVRHVCGIRICEIECRMHFISILRPSIS